MSNRRQCPFYKYGMCIACDNIELARAITLPERCLGNYESCQFYRKKMSNLSKNNRNDGSCLDSNNNIIMCLTQCIRQVSEYKRLESSGNDQRECCPYYANGVCRIDGERCDDPSNFVLCPKYLSNQ